LRELRDRRSDLLAIFGRKGAFDVRVFGSVARGDSDERSDVDFLVSFEPGRSVFDLAGLVGDWRTTSFARCT
jgi:predicted nucleotidyltransferase